MPLRDERKGRGMLATPGRKRGTPIMNRQGGGRTGGGNPSQTYMAVQQLSERFDNFTNQFSRFIDVLAKNQGISGQTQNQNQGYRQQSSNQGYQTQSERAILDEQNRGRGVPTTLRGDPDSRFKENIGSDHKTLEGKPDERFKENVEQRDHLTKDGNPDHRFAENRGETARIPYGEQRSAGPHRGNYSGEETDPEGRPLTKDGKPDRRFLQNRNLSEEDAQEIGQQIRTEGTAPPLEQTLPQNNQNQGSVRPPSNEREISQNKEQYYSRDFNSQDDPSNRGNIEKIQERRRGKIELNGADLEELMHIPSMGERRAASIIAFRDRKQGFESWDDLSGIPGISKGMLGNLQEFCSINDETFDDYLANLRNEENGNQTSQRSTQAQTGSGGSSRRSEHPIPKQPQELMPLVEEFINQVDATDAEKKLVKEVLSRASSRPPTAER